MSNYEFTNDWFEYQCYFIKKYLPAANFPGPINILEIGAHEGRGTVYFIDNYLENEKSHMYTIDPFDCSDPTTPVNAETYERFIYNVNKSKYPDRCTHYKEYSGAALSWLVTDGISMDIILVDGSHIAADVLADAVLAFSLLKEGGYIVFDDYAATDPKLAIDAFLSCYKSRLTIIHSGYHLIIQKVTKEPAAAGQCTEFGPNFNKLPVA